MTMDPLQLLRRLEPPVRPAWARGAEITGPTSLEQAGFADLLQLVARGQVASGRAVTVGFEPASPLSEEQMLRLASAADLAETHGARRSLMLIDGRGLVLDVPGRTLTDELGAGPPGAVAQVDAAVWVEGSPLPAPQVRGPQPQWLPPAIAGLIDQDAGGVRHAVRNSTTERPVAGAPGVVTADPRPEPTAVKGG
jgi:hypothetical protein